MDLSFKWIYLTERNPFNNNNLLNNFDKILNYDSILTAYFYKK